MAGAAATITITWTWATCVQYLIVVGTVITWQTHTLRLTALVVHASCGHRLLSVCWGEKVGKNSNLEYIESRWPLEMWWKLWLTPLWVERCRPSDRNQHLSPLAVPAERVRNVLSVVLEWICTAERTPHSRTPRAMSTVFPVFVCNRSDRRWPKISEYLPFAGDPILSTLCTLRCPCLSNVSLAFSVCSPTPFLATGEPPARRPLLYAPLAHRSVSVLIGSYSMASTMTTYCQDRCQCSTIYCRLYWNLCSYSPYPLSTTDCRWQLDCMDYVIALLAPDWIQYEMNLRTGKGDYFIALVWRRQDYFTLTNARR